MTKPNQPDGSIYEYSSYKPKPFPGRVKGNRVVLTIYLDQPLLLQIKAEADRRGWAISRMIRHLCEASIEGIE